MFSARAFQTAMIVVLVGAMSMIGVRAEDGPVPFRLQKPRELEEVGVEEHRDERLPLDAKFRDESGRVIRLKDMFPGDVPVILSLNYSNCPMLCSTQLNGLTNSLRELEWSAGSEYRMVSISIDPKERPERAKETRDKYVDLYGRGEAGWNFLVGPQASIDAVTEAVGFRYTWVPERQEYAHAAVAVLCTPDGRISRYLYGVAFPEQTLRLSLVEASEGKIGGAGEQILLFCFHYDPETGTYAPRAARMAMSVGGCVMVLAIITGAFVLRSREPQYEEPSETDTHSHSGAGN